MGCSLGLFPYLLPRPTSRGTPRDCLRQRKRVATRKVPARMKRGEGVRIAMRIAVDVAGRHRKLDKLLRLQRELSICINSSPGGSMALILPSRAFVPEHHVMNQAQGAHRDRRFYKRKWRRTPQAASPVKVPRPQSHSRKARREGRIGALETLEANAAEIEHAAYRHLADHVLLPFHLTVSATRRESPIPHTHLSLFPHLHLRRMLISRSRSRSSARTATIGGGSSVPPMAR